MNLAMLLEMAAGGYGEREALRCEGASWSYEALFAAAGATAQALRAAGARHAALLDVTSPAVPIALFGAAWAGVPFAPLSYRLTEPEVEALLERLAPVWLVTDAARAAGPLAAAGGASAARRTLVTRERLLAPAPAPDARDWPDDGDAIALLLFTSGTTGAPKAAVLRHRHLVSYVLGTVEFGSAGDDEAALVAVPPYHVAGMAAILSSVYAGRRLVQLPEFRAEAWIQTARAERVTHAFVVPTMLARIVDALAADGGGLPALRALAYGGGPMPAPVIERALALLPHVDFTNAYGLTETSSTIALLDPEQHRAAAASSDPRVRRRLGSVGRALPGVEIQVRGPGGRVLPPGETGEVYVRGEQVAGEYLGAASRLDAEGWFATRDQGWLDDEGFLFVCGRLDDVIVRGGENLSPGEIEEVLRSHPDVVDCAVVGVPDAQWGEAVAAAVVPRAGAALDPDALRGFVRERLRSSRTPERIVLCEALPYTETGKLLRRRVREELFGAAARAPGATLRAP
ncbi:MAG TPA: class I adenylate-forming enzyme family protein [Myxococcota bacterium]